MGLGGGMFSTGWHWTLQMCFYPDSCNVPTLPFGTFTSNINRNVPVWKHKHSGVPPHSKHCCRHSPESLKAEGGEPRRLDFSPVSPRWEERKGGEGREERHLPLPVICPSIQPHRQGGVCQCGREVGGHRRQRAKKRMRTTIMMVTSTPMAHHCLRPEGHERHSSLPPPGGWVRIWIKVRVQGVWETWCSFTEVKGTVTCSNEIFTQLFERGESF